jgi:photosystem II stability/assembly factor-like uncharacterized protein
MIFNMRKTLFFLLSFSSFCFVNAQWTATTLGGSSDLTAHNGKLFALTAMQKLVVSSDNGTSWTDITTDTLSGRQDFLASAGNRLYVATYNNGTAAGLIYYTTDEGVSWQLDTAGMPPLIFGGGKADVRVLQAYNSTKLVGNFGGADAYYTKDITDASWTIMPDLASLDPDKYLSRNDTLLAFAGNGMRFSTDNGQTFSNITTSGMPAFQEINAVFWDNNRIYLGADMYINNITTIFYSDDFGSNWDSLSISKYVGTDFTTQRQTLTAFYANGSNIYFALYNDQANTTADIFLSTNGGQSFLKDSVGLTVDNFQTEQVIKLLEVNGRLFSVHNNTDIHYKSVGNNIGLNESKMSSVGFYPNPASHQIHFEEDIVSCYIYSLDGRLCHSAKNSTTIQFDLRPGIYLVKATDINGLELNEKLIIE